MLTVRGSYEGYILGSLNGQHTRLPEVDVVIANLNKTETSLEDQIKIIEHLIKRKDTDLTPQGREKLEEYLRQLKSEPHEVVDIVQA